MRNSLVRIKTSSKFKLPVDATVEVVYTVEHDNLHHVKLVGIEQWISKDCVEFVDSNTQDFQLVFEERTITIKSYKKRLLLNGIPVLDDQYQGSIVEIVADMSSPIYRKEIPEVGSKTFFELKPLQQ